MTQASTAQDLLNLACTNGLSVKVHPPRVEISVDGEPFHNVVGHSIEDVFTQASVIVRGVAKLRGPTQKSLFRIAGEISN